MLDIDEFKPINDQFSHVAGDKSLGKDAQGFRGLMQEYDEFGRAGGEEFLMILSETSLGVSERTEEIPSVHHLVERADQAMYLAKERGRNQTARWTEAGNNKTGVPC